MTHSKKNLGFQKIIEEIRRNEESRKVKSNLEKAKEKQNNRVQETQKLKAYFKTNYGRGCNFS